MGRKLLEYLFPSRCVVCNKVLKKSEKYYCTKCSKSLHWISGPVCMRCGKPLSCKEQEYCYDCQKKGQAFDKGFALWVYDKTMKGAIARMKYGGDREHIDYFALEAVKCFGDRWRDLCLDAIIPVPLHPERQEFRGFNQAGLIAEKIGQAIDVPVLQDVLIRTVATAPQKGLDHKARKKNVAKAFEIAPEKMTRVMQCNSVMLLDDIYTTGNTINACANKLRQSGVTEIYFFCLCTGEDI